MKNDFGLNDVCLSIPCVIGFEGIEAKAMPKLEKTELFGLRQSAQGLRRYMEKMNLSPH